MEFEVLKNDAKTEVGSYFVSNYPPYSAWRAEHVPAALSVLSGETRLAEPCHTGDSPRSAPLGLYLHVPFCRKRCKFCYFRVYTDKNGRDVEQYMQALADEIALYAQMPAFEGREFEFVYFGGGTPSFLSGRQLERLIERINQHWRWDAAREVTFECEPGTLKKNKLETIKSIGVTRLSLGIEHFDDAILEMNGRAHLSPEILRAYEWAREVGFAQINVDLIAGMVGDTDRAWEETVAKTLALEPDSLTVYQMELPHNAVFSERIKSGDDDVHVADWETKRRWVDYAFGVFEQAGYTVSSAYTVAKANGTGDRRTRRSDATGAGDRRARGAEATDAQPGAAVPHSAATAANGSFVYRDALWRGADMVGTGVASISHVGGVHFQNVDGWGDYHDAIGRGELPIGRALPLPSDQRLIREMILQMKLGRLDAAYFRDKFAVEIAERFADAWASLTKDGFAEVDGDEVRLTRAGLLRVDGLLPRFYESAHRDVRYT